MQHITGLPRNQMVFSSLEDTILPENPVRFIDAFVEALSLETLGFSVSEESRYSLQTSTRGDRKNDKIKLKTTPKKRGH